MSTTQLQSEKVKLLQGVLDKTVDNDKVFGISFALKKDDIEWQGASGNLSNETCYFIASTTKLFTTAIILKLSSEGKLQLDDLINRYVKPSMLNGLHLYKEKDYSNEISIKHLLAHTSGLPDYFQDQGSEGKSLEKDLINGNDQSWSFEQAMERTKTLNPHFAPGEKGKAHYSDANFQLLGHIIEIISCKSYAENCMELIITPLGLSNTYLYQDIQDTRPSTLYYKTNMLRIPKAMASFGPDGGMVSNSSDMLVFIEAFFTGKLFPSKYIIQLQEWNRIFFPFKAGIGIHLFKLPWIFNPIGSVPYYIGHSGLSGALAYWSPKENLFIAGTVNQVAYPDISFRTIIKLTRIMMKN